ncbi:MAG: hypothetical protein HHJ11_02575 [Phycicoccus sp.]|nr:hypothetical protein [Phycicoccus sp.]NMM34164.1 hypothetical protein [Phycicoccus sp.]
MFPTLVSAAASPGASLPIKLLVVIVAFAVAVPLLRKVRAAASESRKRRWVKDGLMDPPIADSGSAARSDRPEA